MERLKDLVEQLKEAAHLAERNASPDSSTPVPSEHESDPEASPLQSREPGDELATYRARAHERGLPFLDAVSVLPLLDHEIASQLPRELREKHRVVPIAVRGEVVRVASDDPGHARRKLRRAFGVSEVEYVMVTPTTFQRLQWAADLDDRASDEARSIARDAPIPDDLLAHDPQLQAESVASLETILVEALSDRASDIHLENQADSVRVRIRVDGDLRALSHYHISKSRLRRIVRVVKVKSGIDIAEQRVSQAGQFEALVGGARYFIRVQTQPTVQGENVVMRLLPQSPEHETIEKLGFSEEAERHYRRLLSNPGGLVLVVGPTGSGKSTTLYAGLRELAKDEERKVISIEDPVEYGCEGIQQVRVAEEVGFGFSQAMRAFVRQDPNVILLGEIRDPDSALEAIRASQTGHLVLTTLHCNDAIDAVQRLLDLGMLANSVSSELLAIFAQRLAKRICNDCREPAEVSHAVAAEVFPLGTPDDFECYRGAGCEACGGTGYRGRIAVVEYLPMNPRLRDAIAHGATLEELRSVARETGIVSLRQRALELVRNGVIDFESLPRFIPLDRLVPPPRD